jgi:hypothetical protein
MGLRNRETAGSSRRERVSLRRRSAPVLGVFVLSPICAEYLIGYDDSVGDPVRLLGGLLILGPLYGAPALLLREAARRLAGPRQAAWPTMLLFAAALGIVEAGIVDQSIFNDSYRDIESWDVWFRATYVPALGFGLMPALAFVVGHMVWSFGVPIAVVEALAGPDLRDRAWLRPPGIALMGVLYGLAMLVIFRDHVATEHFVATPAHLAGAAAVGAALAAAGVLVAVRGRRDGASESAGGRPAPAPRRVGVCSLFGLALFVLAPQSWAGLAVAVVALAVLGAALLGWSRRPGWGERQRFAAAAGALVVYSAVAFVVVPLGDVGDVRKFGHNGVFALGVAVLVILTLRRLRRPREGVEAALPPPTCVPGLDGRNRPSRVERT